MTDASLFAIGGGVTFLFLAGAYRVLRSRFVEAYGMTNRTEDRPDGEEHEDRVVRLERVRAGR